MRRFVLPIATKRRLAIDTRRLTDPYKRWRELQKFLAGNLVRSRERAANTLSHSAKQIIAELFLSENYFALSRVSMPTFLHAKRHTQVGPFSLFGPAHG